jgi:putative methyltransferase
MKFQQPLVVQMCQPNYRYGNNAYFPYSVGLLQAFCEEDNNLKGKVVFKDAIFLRLPFNTVLSTLKEVNVVGFSNYIWNWNYNLTLAKKIKEQYPHIFICFGGPQVPLNNDHFLLDNKFIDAVVDNEGEVVFRDLLIELSSGNPNLAGISGIRFVESGIVRKTPIKNRIEDLTLLPSPYLSGTFDNTLKNNPDLQFQATQETHRGCPYSCTFCDWGSATMTKVRRFSYEKLNSEYEWFGVNRIELLYNADANYGLFPEDIDLTNAMINAKRKFGYPKKFRAAYAKNSNDRVFNISKALEDEDMCKGVTLSFQSMDTNTLDLIKRRNMKINNFKELITTYRQSGIPTYTELIIGLPGETYESFSKGVDTLISAGQHDSLSIYNAMLLENAEMNSPAYKSLHGIKSQKIPLLLLHGSLEDGDVTEFYDVVIETSTMPKEDWIKTNIFAWGVQAFHCLNLTQSISVALKEVYGVDFKVFYENLFSFLLEHDSYLGLLFRDLKKMTEKVIEGTGNLDFEDRTFGNLMWPVEEIVFLRAVSGEFSPVIEEFLLSEFPAVSKSDIQDLIQYQNLTIRSFKQSLKDKIFLESNWHDFIDDLLENRESNLCREKVSLTIQNPIDYTSVEDYAREVVWYGRKGSSLRAKNIIKVK